METKGLIGYSNNPNKNPLPDLVSDKTEFIILDFNPITIEENGKKEYEWKPGSIVLADPDKIIRSLAGSINKAIHDGIINFPDEMDEKQELTNKIYEVVDTLNNLITSAKPLNLSISIFQDKLGNDERVSVHISEEILYKRTKEQFSSNLV